MAEPLHNTAWYVEKLSGDERWQKYFTDSEIKVFLAAGEAWICKVNELIANGEMLPPAADDMYRMFRDCMIVAAESFDKDDIREPISLWDRIKEFFHANK
jgi:hypothetical protein